MNSDTLAILGVLEFIQNKHISMKLKTSLATSPGSVNHLKMNKLLFHYGFIWMQILKELDKSLPSILFFKLKTNFQVA